jgi:hypothetical protein
MILVYIVVALIAFIFLMSACVLAGEADDINGTREQ